MPSALNENSWIPPSGSGAVSSPVPALGDRVVMTVDPLREAREQTGSRLQLRHRGRRHG
jgi:hypothetical protein